jgi:hypothetical protein
MNHALKTLFLLLTLFLSLLLLIPGCEEETIKPDEGNDVDSRSLAEISDANYEEKTAIDQGIAGTVFRVTQADWAVGGVIIQNAEPVVANVGLYRIEEQEIPTDSTYEPWMYHEYTMFILISEANVTTDEEGFYEIEADIGEYVIAVSEESLPDTLDFMSVLLEDLGFGDMDPGVLPYDPWMDGPLYNRELLLASTSVESGEVRRVDVYLQTLEDPWWPPTDTTDPPPDTSGWPPVDSTTFSVIEEYWELLAVNRERVTIETGMFGTVTKWTGDFMPVTPDGSIEPMQYPIRIHEAYVVNFDSTSGDYTPYSPILTEVPTPLMTEVTPDEMGFYQAELPPGDYSAFAVIGEDSLFPVQAYTFSPMGTVYMPGVINEGDVIEVNYEVQLRATF